MGSPFKRAARCRFSSPPLHCFPVRLQALTDTEAGPGCCEVHRAKARTAGVDPAGGHGQPFLSSTASSLASLFEDIGGTLELWTC